MHCFFGGMRGRIKTGYRVNRPHQPEEKHYRHASVARPNLAAGFAAEVSEGEETCNIVGLRGEKHGDGEDDGDEKNQVTAEIGEQGCETDAEMVQQSL